MGDPDGAAEPAVEGQWQQLPAPSDDPLDSLSFVTADGQVIAVSGNTPEPDQSMPAWTPARLATPPRPDRRTRPGDARMIHVEAVIGCTTEHALTSVRDVNERPDAS